MRPLFLLLALTAAARAERDPASDASAKFAAQIAEQRKMAATSAAQSLFNNSVYLSEAAHYAAVCRRDQPAAELEPCMKGVRAKEIKEKGKNDGLWVQLSLYLKEEKVPGGGAKVPARAEAALQSVGVALGGATPGTEVALVDARKAYDGKAVESRKTSPNYNGLATPVLMQQRPTGDWPEWSDFTFRFANPRPVCEFQFVRPKLIPGPNGVSAAAWVAQAYDASGAKVGDEQKEGLVRCFDHKDCEARIVALLPAKGQGKIASVKIFSDGNLNGKPFAGFAGALLGNVVVNYCP